MWNSILEQGGSVQHLDFLTQEEKDVFKTSFEIDQRWLLELAADRTPYIDQAQSLNLFIPADVDKWDLFGRSPLYMAADVSTLPVKGNGAMAVIPSEDAMTALDVARMLLEAGADPNIRLKRRPPYRDVPQDRGGDAILAQGATALLRAARAGDAPFAPARSTLPTAAVKVSHVVTSAPSCARPCAVRR